MKVIQFRKYKQAKMVDRDEFNELYKMYLWNKVGFNWFDAEDMCNEIEDPYIADVFLQAKEDDCVLDGISYEVRKCSTDFCRVGMYHLSNIKPFRFYMLIDKSTLRGKTVGDYIDARKIYLVLR